MTKNGEGDTISLDNNLSLSTRHKVEELIKKDK